MKPTLSKERDWKEVDPTVFYRYALEAAANELHRAAGMTVARAEEQLATQRPLVGSVWGNCNGVGTNSVCWTGLAHTL